MKYSKGHSSPYKEASREGVVVGGGVRDWFACRQGKSFEHDTVQTQLEVHEESFDRRIGDGAHSKTIMNPVSVKFLRL